MSNSVLTLIKIDFDNMENSDARVTTKVGIFSSYNSLKEWVSKQTPEKLYLGWDEQIYPKYKVEKDVVID